MSDIVPKTRFGLWSKLVLLALGTLIAMAVVVVPNRALPLPDWAVVQIEDRLNDTLRRSLPDVSLSLEAIYITIGDDFVPLLDMTGLRMVNPNGAAVLSLPEVAISFAPQPLLRGILQPRRLRLIGADINVMRDIEGKLNLAFASDPNGAPNQILNLRDIFALSDQVLASPLANNLLRIEAEALSVRLTDQRLGQDWQLGDGFLDIKNSDGVLGGELQFSLQGAPGMGAAGLGRLILAVVIPKNVDEARISARIENVAAGDFAAQIAPLAWLGLVQAPISGRISTTVTPDGISAFEADLALAKGVVQPDPAAKPIAFENATMQLVYDPQMGRLNLTDLSAQSDIFHIRASGHGDLIGPKGDPLRGPITGLQPDAFVIQLQISDFRLDRPDLFAVPVIFDAGALDMRMRLAPFSLDIGQFVLKDGVTRLQAQGRANVDENGWTTALDAKISDIAARDLLAIWPKTFVPGTKNWLDSNVLAGRFSEIKAALRKRPDVPAVIEMGFDFDQTQMRVMPSLPPITNAVGYGAIADNVLDIVLEQGLVTPPLGGDIDFAGSSFRIKDTRIVPGEAEITLKTRAPLTATLSLLNEKPFQYLSNAGQSVTLGQGEAVVTTKLAMTLTKVILPADIVTKVEGEIFDFTSDSLVAGRKVRSKNLKVLVDNAGMSIAGQGLLADLPFDATFRQEFRPDASPTITGNMTISDAGLRSLGVNLPQGAVTGAAQGQMRIDLARGAAPRLNLRSDLNGLVLAIPEIGWEKPAGGRGQFDLTARFATPAVIENVSLVTPDLSAKGRIALTATGALDVATLDSVSLDKWFDGSLDIIGQGDGIGLAITSGAIDMRFLPQSRGRAGAGEVPLSLAVQRLRVSDGIILTDMTGDFRMSAAMSGRFTARVDGGPRIEGRVGPAQNGTAVQVTAEDAGAVFAAAGIYTAARGGAMDLRLNPRPMAGHYDGSLGITTVRVQNASALAELLNAVSVIGLLDQLGGEGILFNNVSANFVLTPNTVELREGAATGASLGVTMQGLYNAATTALDMQGTISPVYLLNGIGEVIAKRGEGVVGFNYTLKGAAEDPQVKVNLMSVLTPGFLRDIFRKPAPSLQ